MHYEISNMYNQDKVPEFLMNGHDTIGLTREQERELTNILINSSLYLDMSQTDRQKLFHDLVLSYFNFLPDENDRALPKAIPIGTKM
jgi:hypothetical protein